GFLVESGNRTALDMAESFIRLDSKRTWEEMSAVSIERSTMFDISKVISKYEELYSGLLST
ncbi:MAG: hypothetical protein ACQEP6_01175, partial [Patescibacteria group bacterium]